MVVLALAVVLLLVVVAGAAAALADDPLRDHHAPAAVPRGHPVPPRPRHRPVPDHRRLLPADAVGPDHQLRHADDRVGRRERRDGAPADPRQRRACSSCSTTWSRRTPTAGRRRAPATSASTTATTGTTATEHASAAAPVTRRRRSVTGPSRRAWTGSVGRADLPSRPCGCCTPPTGTSAGRCTAPTCSPSRSRCSAAWPRWWPRSRSTSCWSPATSTTARCPRPTPPAVLSRVRGAAAPRRARPSC